MFLLLKKYLKVWKQLSVCAMGTYLSSRIDMATFFVGKIIRFCFVLIFIFSLFRFTDTLAGYSRYEVVLFFLTFNLVDVFAQAFFRGIYLFKDDIKSGNFDYVISKPVNPLFYSITRLTDILDMIYLVPIISIIIYTVTKLSVEVTVASVFFYMLFIIIGLVVALSFHIISACVNIWATESENFIWLYRDTLVIGRFPPEVFSFTLQFFFTFIIPVMIMVSFPTKVLLGILSWQQGLLAGLYASGFFIISLLLWKVSLKKYSSASS